MTHDGCLKDTAIVIVTYDSAHEIGGCLEAALRTGAEILVIDNGSRDGTADVVRRFPVRLIENRENRGFAGAVNQGVKATTADYILLLNPDAVLLTGIGPLREACAQPGMGAAAGLLTDSAGIPQAGFTVRRLPTPVALSLEVLGLNRLFPSNPVNWRFRCLDCNLSGTAPVRVEQPAGALFLFRRECWEVLGGFDERFHPLWFEDVDFCARLRLSGKGVLLVPEVVAEHAGAHSILNMALEIRHLNWYGNLLRYAAKHFARSGRNLVCLSVFFGAILRLLGTFLGMNQGIRGGSVWVAVARLAARCFFGRPGWDGQRIVGAPAIK